MSLNFIAGDAIRWGMVCKYYPSVKFLYTVQKFFRLVLFLLQESVATQGTPHAASLEHLGRMACGTRGSFGIVTVSNSCCHRS